VTHALTIRVYYEDTDFSGYVYHANYLKFCERARSDLIRSRGVDQNALASGDTKLFFVIRRMDCQFLKPAVFDDVLTVETIPVETAGARFEMQQRVLRGDDVLFSADVTAVLIDGRGRPVRIPATLAEKLAARAVSPSS
jgi:acyl-CoA thioester hydrolase